MSTAVPARLVRYISFLAAAGLSPWLALAADSQPPAEPVLELPKLTINDRAPLPELESWRYTRIASFEVLSNASDSETKKLLADFQKFQRAVSLAWPAPTKSLAAATLILCGRNKKFDDFLPANLRQGESPNPSLFLRNREQVAIVADLEARRVEISDPVASLAANAPSVEYEIDTYRQLYREYVRYLLSQGDGSRPAWLEEGLAQIVMDIELTDQALILGKIETYRGSAIGGSPVAAEDTDATVASAVVGEQPFNMVLQYRSLLPFDQFFKITAEDEEARHPLGNTLWAKQAYAFVHFCLFGEKLQYKEALATFVTRLAHEPVSEDLFQQCFHISYAEMKKELRSYILHTRHKYQKYPIKDGNGATAATIALTEASAAQVGLLKGDAFRLAAQPEAAFNEYRMAYVRGARDAALLAGLADTQSDPALARRFNDEAVRNGVTRPSIYVTQARTRLAEFKADPGLDGKLTPTQMTAVLTPLFKARSLPSPLPETYELIAEAWAASSVPPKPDHLGVLDEGVRRFPGDSELIHRTAKLYEQAGLVPTALAITRLGLRFATDPAAKTRLDELQAALSARVNQTVPTG
jgi:hypothetical protein